VTDPRALTDEMSLIDSGLVDSTGMMGVIMFIETEFGIQVGDRDTTPDNLESISKITAFVQRKRDQASA
jgi:acyl carrier protein